MNFQQWDIDELACIAMGLSEEEKSNAINNDELEDLIEERYETDLHTFSMIVRDLLPLTPIVQAGLSKKMFHAFVHNGAMVVRQEVAEDI